MFCKTLKTTLASAAAAMAVAGVSLSAGVAGADPWRGGDRHGGDHHGGGGEWRGGGDRDGGYRGGDYRGGGDHYGHGGGWRDRGGDWHGRDDWGAAFGAGVLGVIIGESLSHPYYGAPPERYAGGGYWGDYGDCRAYWRWSPRWRRYVREARCY